MAFHHFRCNQVLLKDLGSGSYLKCVSGLRQRQRGDRVRYSRIGIIFRSPQGRGKRGVPFIGRLDCTPREPGDREGRDMRPGWAEFRRLSRMAKLSVALPPAFRSAPRDMLFMSKPKLLLPAHSKMGSGSSSGALKCGRCLQL